MELYDVSWLRLLGVAVATAVFPYTLFVGICGTFTILRRKSFRIRASGPAKVNFAVVIPAHNEGNAICRTIESVLNLDYPRENYRLVVIADNCDDDTADIARAAGAEVLERSDPGRRSKGHALADSLPRIFMSEEFREIDAVLVVDADTVVDGRVLLEMQQALLQGCDWLQGLDVVANPIENWRTKLTAFGFALFNGSFQMGSQLLAAGAHLRGNGMCFSRRALARVPWQAGGLAEDLEFSWVLRLAGERVRFVPTAIFFAEMPVTGRVSASQRQRWEKGRHGLWKELRGKVIHAKVHPGRKLSWVIDLTMPSFTTLVSWYLLGSVLGLLASQLEAQPLSAFHIISLVGSGLCLGVYALSPFLCFRLPWATLTALLQLPYYVIWRSIIALGRTPSRWIRTERR